MELRYSEIFKIQNNNEKPGSGRVLISEPFSVGDIFKRSVVLLTEYQDDLASMGFILNKSIDDEEFADDLLKDLGLGDLDVHISIGGPVATEQIFYLHTYSADQLEGSIEISPGLYWSGKFNILKEKLLSGEFSPLNVRFFVGYSGWSKGQLEDEISIKNAWLVKDISIKDVFSVNYNKMWEKQIRQLEESYKLWTIVPKDPLLN